MNEPMTITGPYTDSILKERSSRSAAPACSALKRLPRELPAEFDILIDDVALHACSPGELQINMQELDAVAQYLCSIGYESWKWHDQLTLRTYFRFRRQNEPAGWPMFSMSGVFHENNRCRCT